MKEDIKNYMEDCVEDMLETVLDSLNACTCPKCKMDIKAMALNSLPAKYVVTKKGEMYTKLFSLQQQFDVDIIAAITRAAVVVGRNPRHTPDDEDFVNEKYDHSRDLNGQVSK